MANWRPSSRLLDLQIQGILCKYIDLEVGLDDERCDKCKTNLMGNVLGSG